MADRDDELRQELFDRRGSVYYQRLLVMLTNQVVTFPLCFNIVSAWVLWIHKING